MRMSNLAGHPVAPPGLGGWPASRSLRGLAALLLALVLALALLSFAALVRRSVQNGEQHRVAMATHSHEVWRCYALHSRALHEACVQELKSPRAGLSEPTPRTAGSLSAADMPPP